MFTRVVLIVLDSVGVGELPDAGSYGDEGSDTLGNISRHVRVRLPALCSLGLRRVGFIEGEEPDRTGVRGAFGRMAEASPGKDSVTGHWELMGLVLERPFPVFPDGFPAGVISTFEERIGRRTLGNKAASGTAIIDELGPEHLRTGRPIVYTSADSVFQIAAHEDIVPVPELYRYCEIAFELVGVGHGVGRVIARPFVGVPGAFQRTANRRDFALTPFAPTLLDRLTEAGIPVVAIGKIEDLFAGRGMSSAVHTTSDAHGMDEVERALDTTPRGLIFANLVDFDTVYGHRNDPAGYAANLERFDARLSALMPRIGDRRSAGRHRRSRQRSHDAKHRPLARARAAPGVRSIGACRRRPRDAADVCGPWTDACRIIRSRTACPWDKLSGSDLGVKRS